MSENRFKLPPDWRMRRVTHALSQTVDWGQIWLDLPAVMKDTQGAGITVAILDTGCDMTHPDLQGAIKDARDFTGSPSGYYDHAGHGTWCAGYIGARNNDIGVCGVAPQAQLLIGKVLGDDGSGGEQGILAGIQWAAQAGADIISMSLGGPQMSDNVRQAIAQFISQPGKFLFAAGGNDGHASGQDTVGFPAKWPETIGVAALDKSGGLTDFSALGPEIAIAGPGYEMVSTVPGGYGTMSGTSMATPCCAGIGALYLAKHKATPGAMPLDNVVDMKAHLDRTGKPIAGVNYFKSINPVPLLAGITVTPPVVPVVPGQPTPAPGSNVPLLPALGLFLPQILRGLGYAVNQPPVASDVGDPTRFSVQLKLPQV